MTYDFFADKADKLEILDFIFKDTDLHVYDSYSPYGQGICQYKTVNEISSKFDLDNGDKFAAAFQLWTPRHKGINRLWAFIWCKGVRLFERNLQKNEQCLFITEHYPKSVLLYMETESNYKEHS